MFLSTLVVEVDFVGSCNRDCWVDGDIGYCDSDNLLVVAFELAYLSL